MGRPVAWEEGAKFKFPEGWFMDLRVATSVLLIALVPGSCLAAEHKLAPELKGQQANRAINVIVQYKVRPGAKHLANLAKHGGSSTASLDAINGLSVSVPANQLSDLSNDPDVVSPLVR